MITGTIGAPRGDFHTIGFLLKVWICLHLSTHTPFNGVFRNPAAVSLLRHRVAHHGSNGILTVYAIAISVRMRLRTRLTPG